MERDAMVWLMDDELMRQWKEATKDDDEITVKKRRQKATSGESAECTRTCGRAGSNEEEEDDSGMDGPQRCWMRL